MTKINWDLVKQAGIKFPIIVGLLAGLLAACHLSADMIGYVVGIIVAAVALLVGVIDWLQSARGSTDAGKARMIERLDPAGKAAVLEKLPDVTKAAAAAQVEGLKVVPTTIEGAQILESLPPEAKAANT